MTLWGKGHAEQPVGTSLWRAVSQVDDITHYQAVIYLGSGEAGGVPWQAVEHLRAVVSQGGPPLEAWDVPRAVAAELEAALNASPADLPSSAQRQAPSVSDTALHPGPRLLFCANRARRVAELRAGGADGAALPLVPAATDLAREALLWEMGQLQDLTLLLREECPWDRKQTQQSIVRYTLEETYELVDAVERRVSAEAAAEGVAAADDDVRGELGDLLFQVYFLAAVSQERGGYDLGQVARGIHRKLVRRHPHIFGETMADTAEQVKANWDQIKRDTEGREGVFHHIPASFPALLLAQKLQARAAEVGFDWPDAHGPLEKVREEQRELEEELRARAGVPGKGGHPAQPAARVAEEVGDVLFAIVSLARKLKVDPELALRAASLRFRERVSGAETLAREAGEEFTGLGLEEQEEYYQQSKRRLRERDGR